MNRNVLLGYPCRYVDGGPHPVEHSGLTELGPAELAKQIDWR